MKLHVIAATILMLLPLTCQADNITTLFDFNYQSDGNGTAYFDVTVGSNPITVTGLDTNMGGIVIGDPFSNFQVYLTAPGQSYSGNELNMGAWTQVATGSGTAAGTNNPTAVVLSNSFMMDANTTYGMALVVFDTHLMTIADGNNQNYSNADLALSLGSATENPFGGGPGVIPDRVWNGTIHYQVSAVPEPSSPLLLLAGMGFGFTSLVRRKRT